MAAKTCILYGARGPLTKAHIWPERYSRLHPGRQYEVESIIGDEPSRHRNAASMDLQPRVFCGSCNSDWGASLEEVVRPRQSPYDRGRAPEILTLPFARQLGSWAGLKIKGPNISCDVLSTYLSTHKRPSR